MTPKEKADQLTQRFYFSLPNNGSQTGINNVHSRWDEGKKCASIAVDEIVQSRKDDNIFRSQDLVYWTQVKQELEKL
jgi:hypothetical protein